ncbi:hypothetical protein NFI96_017925 [Prochilodus magdalenae]|nr:hypothetical protein NFI96_017925 [Prochilodus magdalenae]
MAGECRYNPQCTGDDTFCNARATAGYLNGVSAAKSCSSSCSSSSSSPFYETIGGSLYRKKLEKGCVQYCEVLAEDKRLKSIEAFHSKTPGKPHHTLEDTYRLVAEHYWWEGMYFQVRDFVLGCEECHLRHTKRAECSEVGNISRMVRTHSHEVLSKLNNQRQAGLFCDITLKTGNGHSFVAHKAVLAAVSEYFQELFTEMDSATDPQPHVDLTGKQFLNSFWFSEESLLALLEFSYTSILTLPSDTLMEVAAMARHFRMWHALEACSAIQREQEAGQPCSKLNLVALSEMPMLSSVNSWKDQCAPSGRTAGFKRKRENEQGGLPESSWSSPIQSRADTVEGTDESSRDGCDRLLSIQCQNQAYASVQAKDESFPCSPTRRMKLMDFKSPSTKRKLSPRPSSVISTSPSTSTRSSSPSRRLLRSSPGAALALRRLLPKIDLSSKRKKKSSSYPRIYRAKSDFSSSQSQSQVTPVTPVKVKQESLQAEVCGAVPQDEVHSPRAQEKYRLLSFLGLQRKSLVPGPEELSGWGQKKRLRKLKVSDYSLTTRRKPRAPGLGDYGRGLGEFVGVGSSLSLCDMTRMDLLKKVMKAESQEPLLEKRSKKRDAIGQTEPTSVRATRSQSLMQTDSKVTSSDGPLRSSTARGPIKPLAPPATRGKVVVKGTPATQRGTLRTKQEPAAYKISQPAHRGQKVAPSRTKKSATQTGPPVNRPLRITTTESKRILRYNIGRTTTDKRKGARINKSVKEKTKHNCTQATARLQPESSKVGRGDQIQEDRKNMARGKRVEEKAEVLQGARCWNPSVTNHQHYHSNPLYKAIKEEPADPLPLTQPFPTTDVSDLGKRQSKPPVKLLDQGFLFGLCRPPGGLKREEESVDICLTRSFSHSSASNSNTSPTIVGKDRIRARIMPDRTGLDGPHWAGLGNRSTPLSKRMVVRVKKEEKETRVSQRSKANKRSAQHKVSKRSCKIKREPPKTKNVNKLYPVSSRRTVMLESIRRARLKQLRGTHTQSTGGVHTCLQCRSSYRDCDALIMHRMRHIEGKHWPCPLCSKTFFRQNNVRSHIRTHNPKLYKCRQCIAAS